MQSGQNALASACCLAPKPGMFELLKQFAGQHELLDLSRENRLRSVAKEMTRLENEMWPTVQAVAASSRTPYMALVISGINSDSIAFHAMSRSCSLRREYRPPASTSDSSELY